MLFYIRQHLNAFFIIGVSCLFVFPFLTIIQLSFSDTREIIYHLLETILPRYIINSLLLCLGVSVIASLLGVGSAWLISRYNFKARLYWEWLLLLPAAMPSYIIAFIYADFLEYSGLFQVVIRDLFGWQSKDDYWFFSIRSLEGAIIIMGFVLYPYVYLFARQAFVMVPQSLIETTILYKKNIFWYACLPLARPFIVVGITLVCMETLADFGTVDYFSVQTLTLGIFNVWIGMNNIHVATQLTLLMILFVMLLVYIEYYYRKKQRFYNMSKKNNTMPRVQCSLKSHVLCNILCFIPVFIGFILPVILLVSFALKGQHGDNIMIFIETLFFTLYIAIFASVMIVLLACCIAIIRHYKLHSSQNYIIFLINIGYAFPGVILAIGVLGFLGQLDALYYHIIGTYTLLQDYLPHSLFSGTIMALILGYLIRFHAPAYGAIESGLKKQSPNIMEANAVLGKRFLYGIKTLLLPLMKGSYITAMLIIFVDIMKELPLTLLLRPLNIETLSTLTYSYAKEEMIVQASLPSLAIVITGLIPVLFLHKLLLKQT